MRTGIELARDLSLPVFDKLAGAAGSQARFAGLRPLAIDACVANDRARAVPLLAAILGQRRRADRLAAACGHGAGADQRRSVARRAAGDSADRAGAAGGRDRRGAGR